MPVIFYLITVIMMTVILAGVILRVISSAKKRHSLQDIYGYVNEHNRKEVNSLKNQNKKKVFLIIGAVILLLFPFLIPIAVIGAVIYIAADKKAKRNGTYHKRHGDAEYPHHEDECINCGSDFSGDVNEDCMFCGDGDNYRSEPYEGTYDEDTNMRDDFDLQTTINDFGKSVSSFAKSAHDSYQSSAWKPRIEKASGWLKNELTIQDKDTDEEAYTYSGTYDDVKEEAEGLRVLLRAGIIEKDEYNDRMQELKTRR